LLLYCIYSGPLDFVKSNIFFTGKKELYYLNSSITINPYGWVQWSHPAHDQTKQQYYPRIWLPTEFFSRGCSGFPFPAVTEKSWPVPKQIQKLKFDFKFQRKGYYESELEVFTTCLLPNWSFSVHCCKCVLQVGRSNFVSYNFCIIMWFWHGQRQ
jgi:hypothetical protein